MDLAGWAAMLEASATGAWMRSSGWAYPVVNLAHLLGLVLLIGPILLLDLRLLGFGRHFPLHAVSGLLTPWCVAGLLLLLASGVLLFAADAAPLLANPLLRIKLLLICFGICNAFVFRRIWAARLQDWDRRPPPMGVIQAALSALSWLAVASLGRLIAYA